jgi:hypothetical protein
MGRLYWQLQLAGPKSAVMLFKQPTGTPKYGKGPSQLQLARPLPEG